MKDYPTSTNFLTEAENIVRSSNFGGMQNQAMFWAHTKESYPVFVKGRGDFYSRNNLLCSVYQNSMNSKAYKMDTLPVIDRIGSYFDRFTGREPAEVLDQAWDVFSKAFAKAAAGEHIFVAANDMSPNDYFVRVELPQLNGRISHVTSLEPEITQDGMITCRETKWLFTDWQKAQEVQWTNHHHYLDGSPYPKVFLPPTRTV